MKKILKKILRVCADIYEKSFNKTPQQSKIASIEGWSIVVITDGKSNSLLEKLIMSVHKELDGSRYEIIIVGPPRLTLSTTLINFNLIHIPYRELKIPYVSGWITRKKNIGISAAKYNNVVVTHDYVLFKPGWKKGFDSFGDFDVCTNIIIDMDGERSTDWLTWDYPDIGQALVPYDKECSMYQYLCGIYFIGKRQFLLQNPQLEHLRWGEAEDIEWSKIIREKTVFKLNTKSTIQFAKKKWKLTQEILEQTEKLKNFL